MTEKDIMNEDNNEVNLLASNKNWVLREKWFLGIPNNKENMEYPQVKVDCLEGGSHIDNDGAKEDEVDNDTCETDKIAVNGDAAMREEESGSSDEDKHKKSCLTWFWDDLKRKDLAWVKAVFFFQSASLVVLYPYLTIHMRSLGFSAKDAALVNAAIPAADIFGPPAAGILADKIGNFRVFMSLMTVLNGAACLLLLAVPPLEIPKETKDLCCQRAAGLEESMCRLADSRDGVFLYIINGPGNYSISSNCTLTKATDLSVSYEHSRGLRSINESFQMEEATRGNCSMGQFQMACSVDSSEEPDNWPKSFWSYMCVRVVLDLLRASSLMLFEGAVVVIIKNQGGDYGLQKLFGTAGAIVFGPLAGKVIDWSSGKEDAYASIFYLYFALRLATAILVLKLQLHFKTPARKVFKKAARVLFRFDVLTFLLAFGICGMLWGFLENYLFWYLEDMGSTKLLMGLSLAVGTLAGIPLTISSRWLMSKLGPVIVVAVGLLLYSVRCAGYSFIPSAEYAIIFEVLKPWCTTLTLIASFSFVKSASPVATVATVEGVFGALYFGVGRGLGGLLGGLAVKGEGAKVAFRSFAGAAFAVAVLYCSLSWIDRCRKSRRLEINSSNVKS